MTTREPSMFETLREAVARDRVLPAGRFFEPNESFWRLFNMFNANFVDCGAGMGHVMAEATDARKIPILAIDICDREGQDPRVIPLNAVTFAWEENVWPLICRPNHDGWCALVVQNAVAKGASVIYVGLSSNYFVDIGGFRSRKILTNVGRQGENAYLIQPQKKEHANGSS